MRTKTQLALIRTLQARRSSATSAFTLVELMIVVAVIGILSAVALPQYLQARDAARAGALLGEAIGQAKECATAVAAGGIGLPTGTNCTTSGGTYASNWGATVSNLRCLSTTAFTGKSATIGVTAGGALTCSTAN